MKNNDPEKGIGSEIPEKVQDLSKGSSSLSGMPTFDEILDSKSPKIQMNTADSKEFVSKMVSKISHPQQQDRSSRVPVFNLGEQILAQQRKIATLKRKSLSTTDLSRLGQQTEILQTPPSPQQLIIADIVAKEIKALCEGR